MEGKRLKVAGEVEINQDSFYQPGKLCASFCSVGMDGKKVVLMRGVGLSLDLVVLINSFLSEKRFDDWIFKRAIRLWFHKEEECKMRFGHISDWDTSRVTHMEWAFFERRTFNEDLSRWNVANVTNMSYCFLQQLNSIEI
jgi:surface protein